MAYTHVIWDWNGTLLDDLGWCFHCTNTLLARRGLPAIENIAAYHKLFRFPVIDYYRDAGFDFEAEPFEVLAEEYMALYRAGIVENCPLHQGAAEALAQIKNAGLTQVVLSASEKGDLMSQVALFEIRQYLDEVLGTGDIYAAGKVGLGRAYMARQAGARAVMVGDTLHDFEVAEALGLDCLLIANGHHSRAQLGQTGAPVLGDISEVPGRVL